MVTAVRSLGLQGISGYEVTVECFLSGGLPAFDIVGLGDTAVKESRERVRAAVKNCGVKFPVSRITVNLAPAGRKKEGTLYDLPILLGILASAEEIKPPAKDAAFVGELSLTGTLRAVKKGIEAACGDGKSILITELQQEGGKRMAANAFLNGKRIAAGTILDA